MLYVFGSIPVNKADFLTDFIKQEPSGIFILPEAFLRTHKVDTKKLEEITSEEEKVIVVGSDLNEHEKARIFAYGESDSVFKLEYEQIFAIPYKDSKIRATVRVCSDIFKPYNYTDFEIICHPSSVSLNNHKILKKLSQPYSSDDLLSRLGLKNVAIASSDNIFGGMIIDPSGNGVGTIEPLDYGIKCKTYDATFRKN